MASKPPKPHTFPRSQTLQPPSAIHRTSASTCDDRLDGGTRTPSTRRSDRPGNLVARWSRRRPFGASAWVYRRSATTGTTFHLSPLVTALLPPRLPPNRSHLESPASPPSPPSSPRSPAPAQASKTQCGYTRARPASTCLNSSYLGCRLFFHTARPSSTSTTSPHLSRPSLPAIRPSQPPPPLPSSLPSQHPSQTSPPSSPPAGSPPHPPPSHPAQLAPRLTRSSPPSRSPPRRRKTHPSRAPHLRRLPLRDTRLRIFARRSLRSGIVYSPLLSCTEPSPLFIAFPLSTSLASLVELPPLCA
ncbi:hypothetical protein BJY59DRAFT_687672 [Rhodotorula toruloides]